MPECEGCKYHRVAMHYFGDNVPYEFEYCSFHKIQCKELKTCVKDTHTESELSIGDRDTEKEWRPYFIEDNDN